PAFTNTLSLPDALPISISRNVSVDVPIVGDAKNALNELIARTKPLALGGWIQRLNELKAEYPVKIESDGLNPQDIIERLNTLFEDRKSTRLNSSHVSIS